MTVCTTTNRITSEKIRIDWLPQNCEPAIHVQVLAFEATVSAGTFTLRVNGEETAPITYSATTATLITSINSALDALVGLAGGEIEATGTVNSAITLTASGNGFYRILVDGSSLTGNTTVFPNVTSEVTTWGSDWVILSAELSTFDWDETVNTVDVTAISEYERTEIPVSSEATVSATMYKTDSSWKHTIYAGVWGLIRVFPQGAFVGQEYFVGRVLIDSVSETYPDHEVVENDISGKRQGAWIVPPKSYYAG